MFKASPASHREILGLGVRPCRVDSLIKSSKAKMLIFPMSNVAILILTAVIRDTRSFSVTTDYKRKESEPKVRVEGNTLRYRALFRYLLLMPKHRTIRTFIALHQGDYCSLFIFRHRRKVHDGSQ
jgi:hypothetical protein